MDGGGELVELLIQADELLQAVEDEKLIFLYLFSENKDHHLLEEQKLHFGIGFQELDNLCMDILQFLEGVITFFD